MKVKRLSDFLYPYEGIDRFSVLPEIKVGESESLLRTLKVSLQGQTAVPVVFDEDLQRGVVTPKQLLSILYALKRKKDIHFPVSKHLEGSWEIPHDTPAILALESLLSSPEGIITVTKRGRLHSLLRKRYLLSAVSGPLGFRVSGIMTRKPFTIGENTPLPDMARALTRGLYRRVPVTKVEELKGIVTPLEVLSHLEKTGFANPRKSKTKAKDIMKTSVLTVPGDMDAGLALDIMKRNSVYFLPVMEDDYLVGVLTSRDILEALIDFQ